MSIFSSIQLAGNALQAAQIGLAVTGNNIANASTPGYIRQQAIFEPTTPNRVGSLILGTGVHVTAIKQQTDHFLEERLRAANSDLAGGEAQESTFAQLEVLLGELGETDLSSSLARFFGSLNDVLNQPESAATRNLAVLQGQRLTDDVRTLAGRVRDLWEDANSRIDRAAGQINGLLEKIAKFNTQIVVAEGGGTIASDAVGLRDARLAALGELSQIIDIKAVEQETGSVTVFAGGDFLVFDDTIRYVVSTATAEEGFNRHEIRIEETNGLLPNSSGELNGLITARDGILGGFLDRLDGLARVLAFEFNKLHSSGQGLSGFSELTSEFAVEGPNAALDSAGLTFAPVNGSFQVQIRNRQTGTVQTTAVLIDLNGLDQDTTLATLATALDSIDGVSASVTSDQKLRIVSDASSVEFAFAGDTSGVLAALGINTFFSGSSAVDLNVNATLRSDPGKFAASSTGVGQDSFNAESLANFANRALDAQGGVSITEFYERIAIETTQSAAVSRSVAEGFRGFLQTLEGQQLAISGVNLDEEAVKMITFQRSFQAAAKYISTLSDLLDVLMQL